MIAHNNLRKLAFLVLSVHLLSMGTVAAQAIPVLPPLPEGVGSKMTPSLESCDAIDCEVSAAHILAFESARKLYAKDPVAAMSYSAVIGKDGEGIAITLIPSPFGSRGKAITYVFDATGTDLKKIYVNR